MRPSEILAAYLEGIARSRISRLVPRLTRVRPTPGGCTARCPVYPRRRRHGLSVSVANSGRIALACTGGCSRRGILKALRLRAESLAPLTQRQLDKERRDRAHERTTSLRDACDANQAHIVGLLQILHRLDPHTAKRHKQALDNLYNEARHRWLHGDPRAYTSLLAKLRAGPLADLRAGKSLPADRVLVRTYDHLLQALSPLFRSVQEADQRNKQAASIVSGIVGRPVLSDELPEQRSLSSFCCEILQTTPVTISRARRRLVSWSRRNIDRLMDDIENSMSRLPGLPKDVVRELQVRLKQARRSIETIVGPRKP